MKRNVLTGVVGASLLSVLFVYFFLIPFENKDHSTQLAQWKTIDEHFGLGIPWLGKSHRPGSFGCSGGCLLTATQRISFGPFYYERHMKGSSDNPWNEFMDSDPKLNLASKALAKIFNELDE